MRRFLKRVWRGQRLRHGFIAYSTVNKENNMLNMVAFDNHIYTLLLLCFFGKYEDNV